MDLEGLHKGVGLILRERVNGWATSQNGTPHVYPDHPPLDLATSSYPRATVDSISHSSVDNDIEKDVFVGDILLDVTVYATKSLEVISLLGDSIQAVIDYQDKDDTNGDPYLSNWSLEDIGVQSQIIDEETEKQFTRFNKTQELQFQHVTETTLVN